LNDGIFVGFHGRFDLAGVANEENPLVFADPSDGSYFHFVANDEPGLGHPNGLLATHDSLYVADFSTPGGLGASDFGAIHRIRSIDPLSIPMLGPVGLGALAAALLASCIARRAQASCRPCEPSKSRN